MAADIAVSVFGILSGILSDFLAWAVDVTPSVIAAAIVIGAGWVTGKAAGFLLTKLLIKARIDSWLHHQGLSPALYGKKLSFILGSLLKWYIVILFIGQAVYLFNLQAFSDFMQSVLFYIPHLLGSAVILVAGMIAGEYMKNVLLETKLPYRDLVGSAAKFLVIYFALVMALSSAGIDVTILIDAFRIGFAALSITVAVILGICFGFAFRKDAEKALREWKRKSG